MLKSEQIQSVSENRTIFLQARAELDSLLRARIPLLLKTIEAVIGDVEVAGDPYAEVAEWKTYHEEMEATVTVAVAKAKGVVTEVPLATADETVVAIGSG